jgi:hypothetical protein
MYTSSLYSRELARDGLVLCTCARLRNGNYIARRINPDLRLVW